MYNNSTDISKSMCIMPWIGLATDPSGGIRPCCWMKATTNDKFFGNPKDYYNSNYLKEKKEQFLKGNYPDSCFRCMQDDEQNLVSKRVRENHQWISKGNSWNNLPTEFSIIDLRLSNVCNLGCITCDPKQSSFLKKETQTNFYHTAYHNQNQYQKIKNLNLLNPYTPDQIDDIIDMIEPHSRIYITGGEPSLVKKHLQLLELLYKKGFNKTVELQFNSNFQTLNQHWFDLLKEFNGDMLPSLDAIGKTAEYLRYPCNWMQIDNNIKEFIKQCGNTWNLKIMPTVSILNIFNLKEMYSWWYNDIQNEFSIVRNSLKTNNRAMRIQVNNRLIMPDYFDIKNLPPKGKNLAIEHIDYIIKNYEKYFQTTLEKNYLNDIKQQLCRNSDNNKFKQGIQALERLDKIRNKNWQEHLSCLKEIYEDM